MGFYCHIFISNWTASDVVVFHGTTLSFINILVRQRNAGFSSSYLACSSESVISTARSFRKSFYVEFIKSFRLVVARKWTTIDIAMLQAVGSRDNELQNSYNDERIIMCEKWTWWSFHRNGKSQQKHLRGKVTLFNSVLRRQLTKDSSALDPESLIWVVTSQRDTCRMQQRKKRSLPRHRR